MVAYITPVFQYPNVTAGTWGLIVGAESTATGAQTYSGSGYLQLDYGYLGAKITAVAGGTPSAGSVRYTTDGTTFPVGTSVTITGVTPAGYSGTFTVTASTGNTFDVSNSTTGAATIATVVPAAAVVNGGASQLVASGQLLNLLPQKHVLSVDVRRGRTRDDQMFDVGTMTVVLDNKTGDYDPDNSGTPWQRKLSPGTTMSYFAPGLYGELVYSTGTGAAALNTVFVGFLESAVADHGIFPTVTLTFVDVLAYAGRAQLAKGQVLFSAGDTTTNRVQALCNAAGLYTLAGSRGVNGGRLHAAPQEQPAGSVLELVEAVMVNEWGRVFCSRNGVFTARTQQYYQSGTSQLTLADDASSGSVEYSAIDTLPGHLQLVNQAVLTHDDGRMFTTNSGASQSRYGVSSQDATITLQGQADINDLGTFIANRRANPSTAIAGVTFELRGLSQATVAKVCSVDLSQVITVKRKTSDGRTLAPTVWVEGIDISLTPDSWTWHYSTSPVDSITY